MGEDITSTVSSYRGCSLTSIPPGMRQTKRDDHDLMKSDAKNEIIIKIIKQIIIKTNNNKEVTGFECNTRKSTGSCGWAVKHSLRPWVRVGMMCSIR